MGRTDNVALGGPALHAARAYAVALALCVWRIYIYSSAGAYVKTHNGAQRNIIITLLRL